MSSHDESNRTRRGRPPGTTARELEVIALDLFAEHGFEPTTVEQIATHAGVSTRTFFRYFDSKASVLWRDFDADVVNLRLAFDEVPDTLPMMEAIRSAVVDVNRYRAEDMPELRKRMHVIGSEPALRASAAPHYDAWVLVVSEFAASRLGQSVDSLIPTAIGRGCLGVCSAAFDAWAESSDADLTACLDSSLGALALGFAESAIRASS
jgi:mycofactocin system transcriptional regulator